MGPPGSARGAAKLWGAILFFLGGVPLVLLMALAGAPHMLGAVLAKAWWLGLSLLGVTAVGLALLWAGFHSRNSN